VLTVTLYGLLPFVGFFNVARLPVDVELAEALGLAIVAAALVALHAWLVATRVLRPLPAHRGLGDGRRDPGATPATSACRSPSRCWERARWATRSPTTPS
jgi:hypothetical protein